jgi:AcrR family transcriptional regulator
VRKDAERNRQSLIDAARQTMQKEGADVPMEIIAERAKLTRGTLYRNFPHRQAMYEAVFEQDLETIQRQLSATSGTDALAFVRLMAQLMMVYDKFLISLADMPDYDAIGNEARMVGLIAAPLAAAQAQGALRPELAAGDILMACRMLASNWRLDAQADAAKAFERRFALMMQGLGTTPPVVDPPRRSRPRRAPQPQTA